RGFRIELGEIESLLVDHEGVKEAVVSVVKDGVGEGSLRAYVVPGDGLKEGERLLKEYLAQQLPAYMVPSSFVMLDRIPLTRSGKVDRKALETAGVSPDTVEYEAPANRIEEILAQVWCEVLGVPRVGRNDSFFRLGGDSIKVIQVTNRLMKHHLKLQDINFFHGPVLKEVAKHVRRTDREASWETVVGEVPLTPMQEWFFRKSFTGLHHFNHSVMLEQAETGGFEEDSVRLAFTKIVQHHDALRAVFRFPGTAGGNKTGNPAQKVIQVNRRIHGDGDLIGMKVWHPDLEGDILEGFIQEKANEIQAGMDLSNGPLVKLGLFKARGIDYLLIVIHHLVIDGVSWRILLEDFNIAYRQAREGQEIRFQSKSDSLRSYGQALKYKDALTRREYWQSLWETETSPLPKDHDIPSEARNGTNTQTLTMILEAGDTIRLLTGIHETYNTVVNDFLLAALGLALESRASVERVLVYLEGHGREPVLNVAGVDISRTVGWFTAMFPVLLDMSGGSDAGYTLKHTKEMLRQIPDNGLSFGILRYLAPTGKQENFPPAKEPRICFNYFGQLDRENSRESFFRLSSLKTGTGISPLMERPYLLDISGKVIDGQLRLDFNYNRLEYKKPTIQRLVENYKTQLLELMEHCTGKGERELTPSDLSYSGLELEDLDEIKDLLEDLD
ncbi:MAG: non-ribosomal peptide synthetase, partial [bacterium]|nr:non-ribosomal peptide synthetase [bacterium]